jgi:hypothetical protein
MKNINGRRRYTGKYIAAGTQDAENSKKESGLAPKV